MSRTSMPPNLGVLPVPCVLRRLASNFVNRLSVFIGGPSRVGEATPYRGARAFVTLIGLASWGRTALWRRLRWVLRPL
jgi:hypothetical protein